MTGYTVHTGSTKKFAAGWDQIFKGKRAGKSTTEAESRGPAKSRDSGKSKSKQ
jgi:hypothetical protein